MTAVTGQITERHGAVSVLVNNAGFELAGPVEEIPLGQPDAIAPQLTMVSCGSRRWRCQ